MQQKAQLHPELRRGGRRLRQERGGAPPIPDFALFRQGGRFKPSAAGLPFVGNVVDPKFVIAQILGSIMILEIPDPVELAAAGVSILRGQFAKSGKNGIVALVKGFDLAEDGNSVSLFVCLHIVGTKRYQDHPLLIPQPVAG